MTDDDAAPSAARAYDDEQDRLTREAPVLASLRRWRSRAEIETDTLVGLLATPGARRAARGLLRRADFTTARNRAIFGAVMCYPDTVTVTVGRLAADLGVTPDRLERWYLTASSLTPVEDVTMLASWEPPPV